RLRLDGERQAVDDLAAADRHPQVLDLQHGCAHRRLRDSIRVRCLGSSTSRSPSPSRLNARTVTKMAAPGKTLIHQAWDRNPCAAKSMPPHDGAGGWMPRPRNDSAASDRIAKANESDVCTINGPVMFGSTCRPRIERPLTPMVRATCTQGSLRTESVLARATRAKIGVYTMPMASIVVAIPGCRIATVASASRGRKSVGE